MTVELFICHASEDKEVIARPLTEKLRAANFNVWYDEDQLFVGNRLTKEIAGGQSRSRYAIIILSHFVFEKHWPIREMNALKQLDQEKAIHILPVWHSVSHYDVKTHCEWLADHCYVTTDQGVEYVVQKLILAIEKEENRIAEDLKKQPVIHPRSLELLNAARENTGRITFGWHGDVFFVSAGNVDFGSGQETRTRALNIYCLEELLQLEMVRLVGKGCVTLTATGYAYERPTPLPDKPRVQYPQLASEYCDFGFEILMNAVQGNGRVLISWNSSSCCLSYGAKSLQNLNEPQVVAQWKGVLCELSDKGLLLLTTTWQYEQCYHVSHLGCRWVDFMIPLSGTKPPEASR
jgi:hypothetical protein